MLDLIRYHLHTLRVALADALDPGRFDKLKRQAAMARRRADLARAAQSQYEDAILRINQQARMTARLPGRTVVSVDRFPGGIERETALTAQAVRHVDLGVTINFEPNRLAVMKDGETLFSRARY